MRAVGLNDRAELGIALQPIEADPQFQKTIARMKADLDDVRDDVIGVYQLICR